MAHDIVKIVMEDSYPYMDFESWHKSLSISEKEVWEYLARDSQRNENNATLLTKKAMELYCLEMDIDYIPNSEEYLEKIFRRLITNINMASMIDRGLVGIKSGKLSFGIEPEVYITERGKKFSLKKN